MPHVLPQNEILERLSQELPKWRLVAGRLERHYRTAGWKSTLLAAGAIAHLAELAWHHPALELEFSSLVVKLHTHDANGITERDFALAEKIESTLCWRPGASSSGTDSALEGTPDDPRWRYLIDEK